MQNRLIHIGDIKNTPYENVKDSLQNIQESFRSILLDAGLKIAPFIYLEPTYTILPPSCYVFGNAKKNSALAVNEAAEKVA